MLDAGLLDGRRVRRSFPTRQEAADEKARLEAELRRGGDRLAGIDEETRRRWLALEERCAAADGTLEEAVELWISTRPEPGGAAVTVAGLLERWTEEVRETRSARHVMQVAYQWRDFAAELEAARPGAGLREITGAHVSRHLERAGWSAATRRSRLAGISAVLGWAARRGFIPANPADGVNRPEVRMHDEIRFLTIPEARALLGAADAAASADPGERDCLIYLVLAMFLGVRRREIESANAGDLVMEEAEFIVPLGKASARKIHGRRSRRRRTVEMEPVALAWLARAGVADLSPALPVVGPNFRKRWEAIRFGVLRPWPGNVLRHSYATYHYAMWRDEGRLQANMGHDSSEVLHEHYRGLARKADAEAFWGLFPPD